MSITDIIPWVEKINVVPEDFMDLDEAVFYSGLTWDELREKMFRQELKAYEDGDKLFFWKADLDELQMTRATEQM